MLLPELQPDWTEAAVVEDGQVEGGAKDHWYFSGLCKRLGGRTCSVVWRKSRFGAERS